MKTRYQFALRQVGVVRAVSSDYDVKELNGELEAIIEIFPETETQTLVFVHCEQLTRGLTGAHS